MNAALPDSAAVFSSPFAAPGSYRSYEFMGAHPVEEGGQSGWRFRVWAPHAESVSVVGDFNQWRPELHPMSPEPGGLWFLFIPGLRQYDTYQYAITTPDGELLHKADPFAFHAETRPGTASKLYDLSGYEWGDEAWRRYRSRTAEQGLPINLYEVHLGSWRRTGDGQVLNYREIARYLVPYVKEMGYTGVNLLPVEEHPLDESLGYQVTGYYAATSRFGTPKDFMYLVNQLHQAGISVILDGVSTGFPRDSFGLYLFDGEPCFGVPDPTRSDERVAELPKPDKAVMGPVREFDFSKPEVQNFLLSNLYFWMEVFHADGIHFTGTPKEAAEFIGLANQKLHEAFPYAATFAGEPEALTGFVHRWNTNWVNKILERITDPSRSDSIFAVAPRPSSTCVLPLCHDLVAPPYPSLAARMQGDDRMKFAQVRAFYLFYLTQPGSKLTMMGTEFGQMNSWNCLQSLDWHLLQYTACQKQQKFFRKANALYLSTPAFWERDSDASFQIIKNGEGDQIIAYTRQGRDGCDYYIAANFSTVPWMGCRWMTVPCYGTYEVLFSTDRSAFGGQGLSSKGLLIAQSGPNGPGLLLNLSAMSAMVLRCAHPEAARCQSPM